jgi:GNAT superfamily N-acetyltransferase
MSASRAWTDRGTIRRVQAGDEPRLAELAAQLGYPSTPAAIRRRLAGMEDAGEFVVYVAEDDEGRLAGWMGVYVFRTVETDPTAEISGLIVDDAMRSQGVGGALVAAAEAWARARGSLTLAVRSNVVRTRAHAFYAAHGFVRVKTQAVLSKRL